MKPKSSPARVLVVDDDAMSRELLGVLLEAEGYAVECAESGEAALAAVGEVGARPGLVLTDVQLPGISGAALAMELRGACGAETLLLAMSGSQPAAEAIADFDGFLLKPFTVQEVAAALAAWDSRKQAGAVPAKKEKRWNVVHGPASPSFPKSKLVSIQASKPPAASKRRMETQAQNIESSRPVYGGSPAGVQVLNETIYQKLADAMPAQQLLEMYSMCLDDVRDRIAQMRRLAAAHDDVQFVRQAHAIKGGCGMLGATELHGMAAALEKTGPEGGGTDAPREVNSLDELNAACDRLERMLESRA
jgi:DNA-binding response OmpR family regulator/HPt (histidine-containing phosphotransfer) domain-containing protein